MFTIAVRLDEKRSTTSQYENKTVGVLLEAQNLELNSRDDIMKKAREMFSLATAAVNSQFHQQDAPPQNFSGHGNGQGDRPWSNGSNDHGNNVGQHDGNGQSRRRSFGRPDPEPTPKQKQLLARISRDRHLGPEQFGEICSRMIGKPLNAMDRRDVSRLIEGLLADEAA